MKRIVLVLFITFITFISCNKNELYEDVVSRHEDGSKKEVRYYQINRNGSKTWVKESLYYMEGMRYLEGPIVDDKRNGEFKSYYKSGKLMSSGEFVDGLRVGRAVVYHENGKIHYEGNYHNGKECGIWKFYDENGKLQKEVNRDLR